MSFGSVSMHCNTTSAIQMPTCVDRKGAIEKKTLEAGWEGFKKNGNAQNQSQTTQTTEKVARRRKAVALPKTTGSGSFFEMVHRNRNTQPSPIPSISTEPYVHQYRIFHVIDGVGKSTLASKKPWTTNMTEFVPPNGAENRRSTSWQSVSDKFSNIATLSKTRVAGTVKSLLKDASLELSKATESRDPSFLIYFWRICVDLSGIRLHSRTYFGEFVFLRVFLRHLRDLFLQSSGNPKDDLVVFVESFFQIVEHTPRDLTVTLGLSCWKTIHMFGDMISHEHPIVLNMVGFCTKHWKSKFKVDEDTLDLKYKSLFDSMNRRDCGGDAQEQEKISILYDHTYALSN
jgi:hypothetical protein